jgi:hypothetical protein
MPTYNFIDTKTNEEIEIFMPWSQREEFLKINPWMEPIITAPAIVSGVSSKKAPSGFNEVLSKVAEAHPTSVVGQRHGQKSIKQVQTEQVVKKHVDRVVKRMKK